MNPNQIPINHFLKECNETFRCIYVNCFQGLRFLAKASTKSQKMHFFDILRTITQEENMETRQKTPCFHLFFPLWLFVTFIFAFENSQNSFACDLTFCPFWSAKYLNFGQKLPIRTAYPIFLECRHPDVIKNPYYVLSP